MTTPIDPHAWLLGSGVPSAKFDTLGKTVAGPIVDEPVVRQQTDFDDGSLKFWDDGSPMMQLLVTIATDERDPQIPQDEGHRRLYVKGNMQTAVATAVRAAGQKLAPGGVLSVTYLGDDEPKKRGMSGAKRYTASYAPPAAAFLEQGEPAPAHPTGAAAVHHAAAAIATAPHPAGIPAATPATPAAPAPVVTPPAAPAIDPAAFAAALAALNPEQRRSMGLP